MMTHKREIMIYYNPEANNHKQIVGQAKGLVPHVKAYSYEQSKPTTLMWRHTLDALGVHPKQLMNKALPYYQEHLRGREFDDEGWLNILVHNPELVHSPIAMRHREAVICDRPSQIVRLADKSVAAHYSDLED